MKVLRSIISSHILYRGIYQINFWFWNIGIESWSTGIPIWWFLFILLFRMSFIGSILPYFALKLISFSFLSVFQDLWKYGKYRYPDLIMPSSQEALKTIISCHINKAHTWDIKSRSQVSIHRNCSMVPSSLRYDK